MTAPFDLPPRPVVPIVGRDDAFPVHRIYCVGRNYAEHAREMGADPSREPPFFFCKPADALVLSGATTAYPPRTTNLHHEIELVIAIGRGGRDVPVADALSRIYGYAVGNDLTRRDLQGEAKAKGQPWDVAKGFDDSAVIGPIQPAAVIGHPSKGRIWLEVNGELRQQADIADLTWRIPEIVAELSTLFALRAGDLIYTGTPAGVGALRPGDRVEGGVDGVGTITHSIGPRTA